MTHTITINGIIQDIQITPTTQLSDILSRYAAYTTATPIASINESLLWVLIDEEYMVDADEYNIYGARPQSVITIEYAFTFPCFKRYLKILHTHGIEITMENCALLLFSLFTWIKKHIVQKGKNIVSSYQNAKYLMHHMPHHFNQPTTLVKVYNEILRLSTTNPELSIHHAFNAIQ